jgi:polygalacturonase
VRIDTPDGPNNDGIDIDSSSNVVIEDCELNTSDDCIALKSGLNEDGWRVGRATENIVIRRVKATGGCGGITIGSEMSGGVRNVFVHDCHYDGPSAGIRMKAARGRGGVVENIHIRGITMGRINGDAIQMTTEYPSFARSDGAPPDFRDIHIRDVTCADAQTAVRVNGVSDAPFRGLHLQDIMIDSREGLFCSAGKDIRLTNVNIAPRTGPVMSLKDSQRVTVDGLHYRNHGQIFLDLRGRQTRDITLRGESASTGRPLIVLGIDVPKDALHHE